MGKLSRRFASEVKLYVRQLAWLHAAPRPENAGKGFDLVSRLRRFQDEKRPLPLPPCPSTRLIEQLLEVGPILQTGQGRCSLTWAEIQGWADLTRAPIRPWDARQLHELSAIYLAALIDGEATDCPPYFWVDEDLDFDPVEDALEQIFAGA